MQIAASFLVLAIAFTRGIESKPFLAEYIVNNHDYQSAAAINAVPQYNYYQDPYPQYYVYNVNTEVNALPSAAFFDSTKPTISHLPAYNLYYGTPFYDFRFPLNVVYPVLRPSHPGLFPKPVSPPATTPRPVEGDDDGIEKLDTKVEPETEMKQPQNESVEDDEDDSIAIEAI